MKQVILDIESKTFLHQIKKWKVVCVLLALGMIMLNVLFCLLRNDTNHTIMLILNILVDIIAGWLIAIIWSFIVSPRSKLLKLVQGNRTSLSGYILDISNDTQRNQGIDCHKVFVDGDTRRTLFLPEKTIVLNKNQKYNFSVVSNVIVEVEYE